MKEEELRKRSTCAICHQKIGECGMPTFWTVTMKRHIIDMGAVQRQTGLAMMLGGNGLLAAHMGPNEEMSQEVTSVDITVCESCAIEEQIHLYEIVESVVEDGDDD